MYTKEVTPLSIGQVTQGIITEQVKRIVILMQANGQNCQVNYSYKT